MIVATPLTLDQRIEGRVEHLTRYQSARLAKRYRKLVDQVKDPRLKEAVMKGITRCSPTKDEFEVARMLAETRARAEEAFDGDLKLTYHLAPPALPEGRRRPAQKSASSEAWPSGFGRFLRGSIGCGARRSTRSDTPPTGDWNAT